MLHFLDCTFLTLCRNCISDHCRWSSHCGEHIAPYSGLIPRPLFTCLIKSSLGMRPQAPVFGRLQFADLYSIAYCMQSKTGMRLISNYYFTRNSQVYMSSLSFLPTHLPSSIAPLSLLPPHPTHTHTPSYFPSLPFSYPQGTLRGFDQTVNLILAGSHERVYSTSSGVEVVQLGLYIIRGDNM